MSSPNPPEPARLGPTGGGYPGRPGSQAGVILGLQERRGARAPWSWLTWPGPGAPKLRSGADPEEACRRWVHLWAWPTPALGAAPRWWRQWVSMAARSGAGTTSGARVAAPRPQVRRCEPGNRPAASLTWLCWKAGHRCPRGGFRAGAGSGLQGSKLARRLPVGATRKWRPRQGVGWGRWRPNPFSTWETVKALRVSLALCVCVDHLSPGDRSRGPPPSSPQCPALVRRRSFYSTEASPSLVPSKRLRPQPVPGRTPSCWREGWGRGLMWVWGERSGSVAGERRPVALHAALTPVCGAGRRRQGC